MFLLVVNIFLFWVCFLFLLLVLSVCVYCFLQCCLLVMSRNVIFYLYKSGENSELAFLGPFSLFFMPTVSVMSYNSHLVAPSTCLIRCSRRPQRLYNSFSSSGFQLWLVCVNYTASSSLSERLLSDTWSTSGVKYYLPFLFIHVTVD